MSEGRRKEGSERRETEGKKLGREGEKREEGGRVRDYEEKGGRRGAAALEFYIYAKSMSGKKLICRRLAHCILLEVHSTTVFRLFSQGSNS